MNKDIETMDLTGMTGKQIFQSVDTQIKEGWEEEFDTKCAVPGVWGTGLKVPTKLGKHHYDVLDAERVKSFIRSLRHTWLQQEIEVLEGMKKEKDYPADTHTNWYNTALQTIIDRYKEELAPTKTDKHNQ